MFRVKKNLTRWETCIFDLLREYSVGLLWTIIDLVCCHFCESTGVLVFCWYMLFCCDIWHTADTVCSISDWMNKFYSHKPNTYSYREINRHATYYVFYMCGKSTITLTRRLFNTYRYLIIFLMLPYLYEKKHWCITYRLEVKVITHLEEWWCIIDRFAMTVSGRNWRTTIKEMFLVYCIDLD